jgi:hypothetical protein
MSILIRVHRRSSAASYPFSEVFDFGNGTVWQKVDDNATRVKKFGFDRNNPVAEVDDVRGLPIVNKS